VVQKAAGGAPPSPAEAVTSAVSAPDWRLCRRGAATACGRARKAAARSGRRAVGARAWEDAETRAPVEMRATRRALTEKEIPRPAAVASCLRRYSETQECQVEQLDAGKCRIKRGGTRNSSSFGQTLIQFFTSVTGLVTALVGLVAAIVTIGVAQNGGSQSGGTQNGGSTPSPGSTRTAAPASDPSGTAQQPSAEVLDSLNQVCNTLAAETDTQGASFALPRASASQRRGEAPALRRPRAAAHESAMPSPPR